MSDRVAASRQRFETSLDDLRRQIDRQFGAAPRIARWALPLVAGAVGLVAGLALRRNLPRLARRR